MVVILILSALIAVGISIALQGLHVGQGVIMVSSSPTSGRKPRTRSVAKLFGIEKAQQRFLDHLADIGSVSETLEKLDIPWNRLHYWRDSDPEFCRKWDEIARRLQAANREKVSKLVPKALEVYDQALDKKTDMKHRLHAADKVLSSEGIIQEPVDKKEIKGVIGLYTMPKYIDLRDAEQGKPFREVIEVEAREVCPQE